MVTPASTSGGGADRGRGGGGRGGGARGGQGGRGQGDGKGKDNGGRGQGQSAKGRQGGKPRQKPGAAPRRDPREETVSELAEPLRKVLDRLPETQRRVLELRMGLVDGHPHDLADTARSLGLSLSEARDIEKRAFEHIREAVPLGTLQRFLDR